LDNFDKPQRKLNEVENEPEFSKNLVKLFREFEKIYKDISPLFYVIDMRRTSMYNIARKKNVKFEYKVFVFLVQCSYVFH